MRAVVLSAIIVNTWWAGTVTAQEASCATYPLRPGKVDVEKTPAGMKIVATSAAPVHFDDTSAVNSAREEAEMDAKAMIAKYLTEQLKSDQQIERTVNQSVYMQGETKAAERKEAVNELKRLRNTASGLLRGVVSIGSCYSPGKEYRVTVGVKPETIAGAEQAAGQMGASLARQPTPGSSAGRAAAAPRGEEASRPSTQVPLNRPGGFSDSDRLNKF